MFTYFLGTVVLLEAQLPPKPSGLAVAPEPAARLALLLRRGDEVYLGDGLGAQRGQQALGPQPPLLPPIRHDLVGDVLQKSGSSLLELHGRDEWEEVGDAIVIE